MLGFISFLGFNRYFNDVGNQSESAYNSVDSKDAVAIEPEKIIYLPKINNQQFTCTGLTYDNSTDTFFLCNYGKDKKSSKQKANIVQMSRDFSTIIHIIPLNC